MTIVEVAVMMRGTMVLVAGYINIGAALTAAGFFLSFVFFLGGWGVVWGVVQWQGWCGDPVGEVPSNSHYGRICGEQVRGISGGGIGYSTL